MQMRMSTVGLPRWLKVISSDLEKITRKRAQVCFPLPPWRGGGARYTLKALKEATLPKQGCRSYHDASSGASGAAIDR